jgi:hypothetical protein
VTWFTCFYGYLLWSENKIDKMNIKKDTELRFFLIQAECFSDFEGGKRKEI